MDNFQLLYFTLIFFLAGITTELIGFGVATVSMALLPFILPLPIALPLVALISAAATGIVTLKSRAVGLMKLVAPLLIGSFIGVPLGILFLKTIEGKALGLALGVFLIAYAIYGLYLNGHLFMAASRASGTLTGLVAGFFGASFNIHGPLISLYSSSNSHLSHEDTKGLISSYMFFTGLFVIAGHAFSGRVTIEVLRYALLALPFLLLGLIAGAKLFRHINLLWLKRGIYIIALAAGLSLLLVG
ncbi:MAG: sulfite exporter TauE/SafE family protein [Candidatus Veblenbacteria bacterium]|nr:sulfite exporter TauE/SafE family protein [Candidatus Veblenbacteria bacterium]